MVLFNGAVQSRGDQQTEIEYLRQRVAELEQERETTPHTHCQQAQILDQTPGSIIVTDLQGTILMWNQASTTIYGYTQEEALGKSITLIHPPEEHERLFYDVIQPLQDQGSFEVEILAWNKEGQRFPIHLSLSLLHDDTGNLVGMIGHSTNITERKQQEASLHIFKALADNSPDAIGIALPNGIITYANSSFVAMFGYGEETIGIINTSLFTEEDQRTRIPTLFEYVMTTGSWTGFLTGQRKDGRTFPIQISPFGIFDNQGNIQAIPAIIRDMTEGQQRENELRTFQSIVENTPDGVSLVSPNGIITYGNAAIKAMLGYEDDYIGLPVPVVFGGDSDTPRQIITHIVEHGFWTGLQTYYRKDGSTIPVHLSISAIRDERGIPLTFPGIVRDMTEIQQREAEREALQQQIIDAQRAALRELSAPLLPISNHIIVLPLVGTIDSQRAQQIMETLLEGVAAHQSTTAIIDITGIQVVDTQVANALVQTAQAVQLLGAQIVLTGIGPSMAQTLVHLGVDLSGIITRGTLQNGITYALNEQNRQYQ